MANTALGTVAWSGRMWSDKRTAIVEAQAVSNANGAPVLVMTRDGWYAICEEPPDDADVTPYALSWTDVALIDPSEVTR